MAACQAHEMERGSPVTMNPSTGCQAEPCDFPPTAEVPQRWSMFVLAMWVAMLTLWPAAAACGTEQPGQLLAGQGDPIDLLPIQSHRASDEEAGRSSAGPPRGSLSKPVSVLSTSLRSAAEEIPLGMAAEGDNSPFLIDFRQRPITDVTTSILPRSPYVPDSVAETRLNELGAISYDSVLVRRWMGLRFCWDAPALHHNPLYFEEVNLERYGYGPRGFRVIQPVISGAHFFATVPTLPYQMATHPPRQPVYALGHYRPGSPAPYRTQFPPLSIPGSLTEAAVIVGLIALIP
jgi:hypothetical protein